MVAVRHRRGSRSRAGLEGAGALRDLFVVAVRRARVGLELDIADLDAEKINPGARALEARAMASFSAYELSPSSRNGHSTSFDATSP